MFYVSNETFFQNDFRIPYKVLLTVITCFHGGLCVYVNNLLEQRNWQWNCNCILIGNKEKKTKQVFQQQRNMDDMS